MHDYANLCILRHAAESILFNSLCLLITKAYVKFKHDRISDEREKVKQTNTQTNIVYYDIDYHHYQASAMLLHFVVVDKNRFESLNLE